MYYRKLILIISFIVANNLQAMNDNELNIIRHQFRSPAKNADLIGLYTHDAWRQVIQNPIPATSAGLREDLTLKAKAAIKNVRYRYVNSNGTLAKRLDEIYSELPKGNSPLKPRKEAYKKTDRVIVRQALSAAAAIAQLTEGQELQDRINPKVRSLRDKIASEPGILNPVPRPINELLSQQKERADAASINQKEEQESVALSPEAVASDSASSAAASSSSSSSSSSASSCAASASSAPAGAAGDGSAHAEKKGKKRKVGKEAQEENVFTEKWQRQQRQKTNANLQKSSALTTEKIDKENAKKTKKWQKAGVQSQSISSFFSNKDLEE